jgi:hypothetical protein
MIAIAPMGTVVPVHESNPFLEAMIRSLGLGESPLARPHPAGPTSLLTSTQRSWFGRTNRVRAAVDTLQEPVLKGTRRLQFDDALKK